MQHIFCKCAFCARLVLDKHITEIVHSPTRFEKIASDYAALSDPERASTRVIAGTRYARGEINRRIRSQLGLADQGQEFVLLDRKDQTAQQARSVLSYENGDLVLAETDYASLGLKRGETAAVVERLDHCIMLERADGVRITWQPALATRLTAYVPVKRSLSVGDLVRVSANDRMRGLVNGDMARVVESVRGQHPEYVFVYRRERVKNTAIPPVMAFRRIQTMNNTAWQRARTAAGLGDLHVHDLRHTVGMRLREAGVSEGTRSDILWHTTASMTQHYSVAQIVELHDALEKIKDDTGRWNKSLATLRMEQEDAVRKLTYPKATQAKKIA